jgi:glycosyltransferase involved in cell wall biosynthesis
MTTEHPETAAGDHGLPSVLMIAYTNYESDPRVIRAAETAVEAGFSVDVLALRRAGQAAIEIVRGVRVYRLPQQRYRGASWIGYIRAYLTFFLRCAVASTRLFLSRQYRVIHVNNMPDVLIFAPIVPRIFGAKLILDIHDPMPETFGAKYRSGGGRFLYAALLLMERLSVAFAHKIVTVNEPVRDFLLAKHGYRAGTIDVIANFADDKLFKPITFQPPTGRLRLVFHGTILARYGLGTLVEAVARMRCRDRIEIRIVGDGDYASDLKALIRARGLEDVIDFRNRVYPVEQIPRVLADCHVGLVPLDVTPVSDYALPLKLVEYTCLELPCITVRSAAIAHYLHPDECLSYTPGSVPELTRLLEEAVEDPERLNEIRKRLPGARERMSWSREKEKYAAMLAILSGQSAVSRLGTEGTKW